MKTLSKGRVGIVIPVFNEELVLPELFTRLEKVMDAAADYEWRVFFADDGSRDRSVAIIREQQGIDQRYVLSRLSRNFGHQAALSAALSAGVQAGCDALITMDADLQDPPEVIPELLRAWSDGGEVILAVRRSREDRGVRRLGFDLFHCLFNSFSDFPIRNNTGTYGLLSLVAAQTLLSLPERHRFFPGLRAWVGFKSAEVYYDRRERAAGTPAQTFRRLVKYAIDGIFSFSYLPLRLMTYLGMAFFAFAFCLSAYFVIRRLLGVEVAFTGFTTLVTLVLFIGGIQLVGIGILGEYLARVYDEVKQRPLYVLRQTEHAPVKVAAVTDSSPAEGVS